MALSSEEAFFLSNPAPSDLATVKKTAEEFIELHRKRNQMIALVTSGGTTVPLEKNTVRFIDNFSSGGRGSKSAEYFLANGYSVIFLHRAKSLKPFERHLSKENPLEWFTTHEEGGETKLHYSGSSEMEDVLLRVLPQYKRCKREGSLLCLPFTTLFQYLFYLREIAQALQPMGSRALIYLAAAVSDFFVSQSCMPNHKIQSSAKLELEFSHTPKMVRPLVLQWAPKAFVVTFKLETDESILLPRAKAALLQYGHQVVIANLLGNYQTAVIMVTRKEDEVGITGRCDEDEVEEGSEKVEWEALQLQLSKVDISRGVELESLIIKDLAIRHQRSHFPADINAHAQ